MVNRRSVRIRGLRAMRALHPPQAAAPKPPPKDRRLVCARPSDAENYEEMGDGLQPRLERGGRGVRHRTARGRT